MLSKETTYSQARMNLASILDQVCDESQIIVIKRRNQKNVALIAEDELSSLLECVYLLRSPENAQRLFLNFPPYIYTIIARTLIHQWI